MADNLIGFIYHSITVFILYRICSTKNAVLWVFTEGRGDLTNQKLLASASLPSDLTCLISEVAGLV